MRLEDGRHAVHRIPLTDAARIEFDARLIELHGL
jgi:hypothetical protein